MMKNIIHNLLMCAMMLGHHTHSLVAADATDLQSQQVPPSEQPSSQQPLAAVQQGVQQVTPQVFTIGASDDQKNLDVDANIYLNFENASLGSIVSYLGEQKKINIIPHKDLENTKVSLTTRKPLTLDRAWNVLLTLLEMNGFTLINVHNVYRIVQSANNTLEPLPTYISTTTEPEALPTSSLVIRYVYFFKSIKVSTAKSILSKMVDEKNLIDNADLNAIVIKDQAINIKAAMKIVKELDDTGLRESIEIIQLKWANADNIQKLFGDILSTGQEERIIRFSSPQQKENTYFSNTTKILAEPVKNNLILLGTQKNIDRIKNFIAKYIDVPIEDADSRLHIRELRYVSAQDIKPIIDAIILPPKGLATEKGIVLEGGFKVFEDVITTAETDDEASDSGKRGGGNRLIVACNRDDWKRLSSFIDEIDKPKPQVAIEVMVVDASILLQQQIGSQLYNVRGKPLAHGVNFQANNLTAGSSSNPDVKAKPGLQTPFIADENLGLPLPTVVGTNNGSYISLGKVGIPGVENVWAFIKAVLKESNSEIITQPYVIANNNQKCTVSSEDSRRIPGEVTSNTVNAVQNLVDVKATIKVDLTPTINLTGTIDLTIDISIDQFKPDQPTSTPARTTRKLTTKTSMAAGEVLALGGLTKDDVMEQLNKTPILGDIPLIGNLFKNRSKVRNKTNLYVFIRPSIIKPRFEGAPDEYTQLKLDYAKYQIMKNDLYVQDRDPVQRWFFKPTKQTLKNYLSDAAEGIYRPIDDFTYGRTRPKMVDIKDDPYFKSSESLEESRQKREAFKQKHKLKPGHSA